MKIGAFEDSIARAWHWVDKANLGRTISTSASLPVNTEFRNASLRGDARYSQIYMLGLSQSHYNFLLNDYSYFQFTHKAEDDLRYAFYPNPFRNNIENDGPKRWSELLEAGMITAEEYAGMLSSAGHEHTLPFFRYEIAASQYKPGNHPYAHFHIGFYGEDRWAVRRFLSPAAFTLLMLKMYYGAAWKGFEAEDVKPYGNSMDKALAEAKAACRELAGEKEFDEIDQSLFFFT
jgi:hypothetical protein